MDDGWPPRRTRLASLAAVGAGLLLLGVLPSLYDGDPATLHLGYQATALFASTVAGPLLIVWGVSTGLSGSHRSLTGRRLLAAIGICIALYATLEWYLPAPAPPPGIGDAVASRSAPPSYDLVPTEGVAVDGLLPDLLVAVAAALEVPNHVGYAGPYFAFVGTTLATRGRRIGGTAGVGGLFLVWLPLVGIYVEEPLLLAPVFGAFVVAPLVAGNSLVARPAPETDSDADYHHRVSRDPRMRRARHRSENPSRERAAPSSEPSRGDVVEPETVVGFATGALLVGIPAARHFGAPGDALHWLPLPAAVATLLIGAALAAWATARAWGERPPTEDVDAGFELRK